MATIKLVLRPKGKSDLQTISFVIIEDRKPRYISTGYRVTAKQFKDGSVVKHNDAAIINMHIEQKRSRLVQELSTGELRTSMMFSKAKEKLLKRYKDSNMVAAHTKLNVAYNHFKEYHSDLAVNKINKQVAEGFALHLTTIGNAKSTIKKTLNLFSNILLEIDFEGVDYFKSVSRRIKPQPVQREKLTMEHIRMLNAVPLEGLYDIARNMFLFSFYCHGMRFENVATFTKDSIQDGVIRYRMNKGKKVRDIDVHPNLKVIIDKYKCEGKYLFPVITKEFDAWSKKNVVGSANAMINKYLAGACIHAMIPVHVHFHMARHTFAYLSLESDVNMRIIMDAMGHSSYSTTDIYLKSLSDTKINKALKGMFDAI